MREIDEQEITARVDQIASRRPSVGLAIGVVRNGSLAFFGGHGLADIASNTPITQDTVFRVASITKTFTAIAVMQLWELGRVDLDAPASGYLRAYRLIPAKSSFRPATVRHLLTHTAGIPELVHPFDLRKPLFGEIVHAGRPVPSLAEYYRGGLRLVAEPGSRYVYTDHGFATLGQIVEDVSGEPLDRFLRGHVFEPLGMTHTDLVRSERVRPNLATGYNLGSHGADPVSDYEVVTVGGGAVYSTPKDMARYVAALLSGGGNEHGSVLKPATVATMFEPAYQPDPRLPGDGLAFSRADIGGHRAVGHGGILPSFISEMWLAPDDGVGVIAFTNGARLAMMWLPAEATGLLGHLLAAPEAGIRADVPHHPEIWADVCGWYQPPAQLTDWRTRAMVGAGAEVCVRRGQLTVRLMLPVPTAYQGFALHPDDDKDPYAFRIDLSAYGIGTGRVVFSQDAGGQTTGLHVDLHPLSLQKQPAIKNPRLWISGAVGALAAASTAAAFRRRPSGSA